jgi:hypothetical protein
MRPVKANPISQPIPHFLSFFQGNFFASLTYFLKAKSPTGQETEGERRERDAHRQFQKLRINEEIRTFTDFPEHASGTSSEGWDRLTEPQAEEGRKKKKKEEKKRPTVQ